MPLKMRGLKCRWAKVWPPNTIAEVESRAKSRVSLRNRFLENVNQLTNSHRILKNTVYTHNHRKSRNWVSFGVIHDTIYDRKLRCTVNYNCRPHIKLSLQNVPILRPSFIQVNLCSSFSNMFGI